MAQGGKPKNRTCEKCGKSLHISDYQKGSAVCIDCVWAEECGITCADCGGVFKVSAYRVSSDGSFRNKTCNACCDARHYGEGRSKEITSKENTCKCGVKAVDWFRGEYLCYDCLNPSETRQEMFDRMIDSTSLTGNGFETTTEEKRQFECADIVHRVNSYRDRRREAREKRA